MFLIYLGYLMDVKIYIKGFYLYGDCIMGWFFILKSLGILGLYIFRLIIFILDDWYLVRVNDNR